MSFLCESCSPVNADRNSSRGRRFGNLDGWIIEKDLILRLPPRYGIPVLGPLETFSRVERVDGIERTVVFDIFTYWQVRATFRCLLRTTLTSVEAAEEKFPNLLSHDGCCACASEFGAMRASLPVRGDLCRSPEQNPTKIHGGPTSIEFARPDRALIG